MFESADLKINRAQEHIGDLAKACDLFVKTHPYTLHIDNHSDAGTIGVEVRLGETIPTDLSLFLGDAIHNLRTALDHATWELIRIDGGTQDRDTKFPVWGNQGGYESACNRIKTPLGDTKKLFIALAAYPGGVGEKLYGLNRLDNADKHNILTPVVGVATVGEIKVVKPNGQSILTMTNCSFSMGPDGIAKLLGNIDPGLSVKFDQNSNTTLDIFFRDTEFFQGLPLIETLMDLSYSVSDVIGQFIKLVEARK